MIRCPVCLKVISPLTLLKGGEIVCTRCGRRWQVIPLGYFLSIVVALVPLALLARYWGADNYNNTLNAVLAVAASLMIAVAAISIFGRLGPVHRKGGRSSE